MSSVPSGAVMSSGRGFWLGVAAYLVPTFPIAYAWHLVWFAPSYDALGIYRPDPIIPFGLISMLIQGVIFSLAYPRFFPDRGGLVLRQGLLYGAGLAILSWSFTTLAVAVDHPRARRCDRAHRGKADPQSRRAAPRRSRL